VYWLVGALALALLAVPLTRGSYVQLFRLRFQAWWLLVVGVGLQITLELVDFSADRIDDVGFGLVMLSYALILAFCFVNLRVPAMALVAVGVAMNATVIGLNEGMPTRDETVERPSGREVERPVERTVWEQPESDDDLLSVLGQVIPLPDNEIDEALSPGDLVIGAGIIGVFVAGSRRRRTPASSEPEPDLDIPEFVEAGGPPTEPIPAVELPARESELRQPPRPSRSTSAHPAADEWEEWRKELRALAGELDNDRPDDREE
jgi:hypothetical protein